MALNCGSADDCASSALAFLGGYNNVAAGEGGRAIYGGDAAVTLSFLR